MAILPLRGLGTVGIIKDIDPFDLPPNAFSSGVNVRFSNGAIQRGPICRTVKSLSSDVSFVDGLTPLTGLDYIVYGTTNGRLYRMAGATTDEITATGWTNNVITKQWTSTNLSDVYYTNREDRVPWYMARGAAQMATLPDWNSGWRCNALRTFNGQLLALGMTEGATEYPTTIRWSDFTLSGSPPSSWTPQTTNSAGRNTLADMVNPIIDGSPLRSAFIIYSRDETWAMEPSLDNNVYNFRRLFYNTGVINVNCVVEFNGMHYVFGFDDIFMHDGVQKKSIAEGRVRQYIYQTMNKKFVEKFFTVHNRSLNEIMFCYVSGDENIAWPSTGEACNRAAVYNYVSDTWTFYDLPMTLAAGVSNIDTSLIWNDATNSWVSTGGSWQDKDDGYKRNLLLGGIGMSTPRGTLTPKIHVFEPYSGGSSTSPVDSLATPYAKLRRDGIDLDEVQAEIRGYKQIVAIYPEGRVFPGGEPLSFQFGAADVPDYSPYYGGAMTFNGTDNYKLDYRDAGRFLSMNVTYNDFKTFQLTALDVDVVVTGRR